MNPLRLFGFSLTLILTSTAVAQAPLSTPGFHHIHLNSTNPEGAIAFYAHQFPSATRVTFAGLPALKTGDLYLLFNKVQAPPGRRATNRVLALWLAGHGHSSEARSVQAAPRSPYRAPLYSGRGWRNR